MRQEQPKHVKKHVRLGRSAPKSWDVCRKCHSILPYHDLLCPNWVPMNKKQKFSGV